METPLQNLEREVAQWRKHRGAAEVSPRSSSPYGVKIHQLDMEWSETKDEHKRQLEAKRLEYTKQRERLLELNARWRADNPTTPRPTGRPAQDHPDAVKIAAAKALQEGTTKTTIRAVLGISSTERLDRILTEGQALLSEGQDW